MKRIALIRMALITGIALLVAGCMTSSNRPPQIVSADGVVYPEEARQQRVEGFVRVEYDVTVDGTVANAHVIESNPPGIFDAAALKAVRSWRFHPAVKKGDIASMQNLVSRVNFKLGESDAYAR